MFIVRKLADADYNAYLDLIHEQDKIFGVDRPSHWKRIEASAERYLFGDGYATMAAFYNERMIFATTMEFWRFEPVWTLQSAMMTKKLSGLGSKLRTTAIPSVMNGCRGLAERHGFYEYVFCVAAGRYKLAKTFYGSDREDYNRYHYVTEAYVPANTKAPHVYQRGLMGNSIWPVDIAIRRALLTQENRVKLNPKLAEDFTPEPN